MEDATKPLGVVAGGGFGASSAKRLAGKSGTNFAWSIFWLTSEFELDADSGEFLAFDGEDR